MMRAAFHSTDSPMDTGLITLAGGCFWCLEAVFLRVRGVVSVESGCCNGHMPSPPMGRLQRRHRACRGGARAFDPAQVSLRQILEVFLHIRPTSLNRQGADRAPSTARASTSHTEAQRELAASAAQKPTRRWAAGW